MIINSCCCTSKPDLINPLHCTIIQKHLLQHTLSNIRDTKNGELNCLQVHLIFTKDNIIVKDRLHRLINFSLFRWKLPLSLLRTASSSGSPVLVELKGGDTYNGRLSSCDAWMNMNLSEVICTSADGDKFWKLPHCYIRGSAIKYLRLPPTLLEQAAKDEEENQKQQQQNYRGGGRGRGRGGRGRGGGRGGRGGRRAWLHTYFYCLDEKPINKKVDSETARINTMEAWSFYVSS